MPKIIKIPLIILTVFTGLLLLFLGIVQTKWFKNEIKSHLISYCEEKLDVKVNINSLEINYFDFIRLNNLYIEGQNNDTLIYANQLSVDYNLQNLFKSEIELDKVLLNGGSVHIGVPKNKKSLNIQFLIDAFKPKSPNPSKQSLPFTIHHLKLENTNFRYFDDNYEVNNTRLFDQNHIKCNSINGKLSDFIIIGDSLNFKINELSTIENSGLRIEHISAKTTISSTTLKFDNLTLKTPSSLITDHIKFRYRSYQDFSNFNNQVMMNLSLLNSYVHTNDISFFTNELNTYDETLKVNGTITGKVQ
ncbi:MAG: AsmA family protein [Bacteroidetes bacterium]|nr:AsmA family protein [Bacteroidota bacterium]